MEKTEAKTVYKSRFMMNGVDPCPILYDVNATLHRLTERSGSLRDQVTGGLRKLCNKKFYNL